MGGAKCDLWVHSLYLLFINIVKLYKRNYTYKWTMIYGVDVIVHVKDFCIIILFIEVYGTRYHLAHNAL